MGERRRFHTSASTALFFKFLINPRSIFLTLTMCSSTCSILPAKANAFAIYNWVSSSDRDPNAIYKNWTNSFLYALALPSAMLEGTDTAALLSCEVKPYSSLLGKFRVNSYTNFTRFTLSCQTFKSLCVLISTSPSPRIPLAHHSLLITDHSSLTTASTAPTTTCFPNTTSRSFAGPFQTFLEASSRARGVFWWSLRRISGRGRAYRRQR